jgi:paraquat-inducible protein A
MALMDGARAAPLIACDECDALIARPVVPHGWEARCGCCGGLIGRCGIMGLQHSVAWASAGVVFWLVANLEPFMAFSVAGSTQVSRLAEGVTQLAAAGRWGLALLVAACSIVVPLLRLLALLWLQVPLLLGKRVPMLSLSWPAFRRLQGWGMLDVYLLGAIVALVKFGDYGDLELGRGFFAFVALVLSSAAAHACSEPERVWESGSEGR